MKQVRYLAEKILLPHPLSFGGDYPGNDAVASVDRGIAHQRGYQPFAQAIVNFLASIFIE
jgi:hypothetical protein